MVFKVLLMPTGNCLSCLNWIAVGNNWHSGTVWVCMKCMQIAALHKACIIVLKAAYVLLINAF